MSPKINLEVFDNPTLSFDYAYVPMVIIILMD